METKKIVRRTMAGIVVSVAMNKTIIVNVERKKMHPKYKKQYRVSRKYPVHDEKSAAKLGDLVEFVECRPLSKTKRWRLAKVVKTA